MWLTLYQWIEFYFCRDDTRSIYQYSKVKQTPPSPFRVCYFRCGVRWTKKAELAFPVTTGCLFINCFGICVLVGTRTVSIGPASTCIVKGTQTQTTAPPVSLRYTSRLHLDRQSCRRMNKIVHVNKKAHGILLTSCVIAVRHLKSLLWSVPTYK